MKHRILQRAHGYLQRARGYWHRLEHALERRLPEQRLFLRSDSGTRFVRLRPWTQVLLITGVSLTVGWTIIASAVLMIDSIGSGSAREQARINMMALESRLDTMSKERDLRQAEAAAAQERFTIALDQVSKMQSALLASEERRRELETGIGLIQTTLRTAMTERDAALAELDAAKGETSGQSVSSGASDARETLKFMTAALKESTSERETLVASTDAAKAEAADAEYQMKLLEQRHDEIFRRIEDAVTISMEPLDKAFSSAGIDPDELLAQVRQGYSGQGGPLGALLPKGIGDGSGEDVQQARAIMDGLDRLNLYRIAVDKTPLAIPLKTSFRYTSGFGRRWGRAHEGVDLAGDYGSPVYATADGVVTHAGWENGYGNMVEIRHPYGLSTRYGHLSKVRATVGQKVSRGDLIGDMGNTGRSTGTHLHYEVRVHGDAIDPMIFLKAGQNVF